MKEEVVHKLRHTDMRMNRWICGALLNDKPDGVQIFNENLRSRMRQCISVVMRRGRLRWFGHIERVDESSRLKK